MVPDNISPRNERDPYIKSKKMKRYILSALAVLSMISGTYAQNVDDALRYSQVFYNGSARTMAMGNAFTSLGADLSAISLNPAGTGMFRSMEFTITPQLNYFKSSAAWNGYKATDSKYVFNMPQIGIVAPLISNESGSGLRSLNIAYSYNVLASYNNNTTITGVSNNSSMADMWARISDGIHYTNLSGGAGIAYDAWVMDTIAGSGGSSYGTIFSHYGDSLYSTYGQTINRIITDEGYKAEHAFSIGANFGDKLYVGATFGLGVIHYTGHYTHSESDNNNVIYDFKNFAYTDHLQADGKGFALKIGAVFRPIDALRIGFAFHAPVAYRMHEYYFDNIASSFDNLDKYTSSNDPMRYDYTLSTPMRIEAGASLQLAKFMILSADYEYVNYTTAKFSRASDAYDYQNENQSINTILGSSNNLRFGAEIRLSSLYLRGGYGLYGSAFAKGEANEKSNYNALSCGVGFRQNNLYLDLGVSRLTNKMEYYMYDDPGYLAPSAIETARNTIAVTIGMKF